MRWLGLLLVVGCSFEHGALSQDPGGDDGTTTGSIDGGSNGGADGAANGTCASAGQRVCVDATHSGTCSASLSPLTDRACPIGSMCNGGYCRPPAGATSCTQGSDCSGNQVCDLYVSGNALVGYCTDPYQTNNGASTSCSTVGYDSATCQTGICAQDATHGPRCLVPCEAANGSSCPSDYFCREVAAPLLIEGVATAGLFGCLYHD